MKEINQLKENINHNNKCDFHLFYQERDKIQSEKK